jgi:hypothetical protein
MKKLLILILFNALTFSTSVPAAMYGCYSSKFPNPNPGSIDNELFVVVDQTTLFDASLKQSIANNIRPFIGPGNSIIVIQFSAFTQGHYTDVLTEIKFDGLLTQEQRNATPKQVLAKFDKCVSNQPAMASNIIGGALRAVFTNSSNGIEKSDVVASLKDISSKVARSKAKRKLVLIASDMLENSSISSFYSKQAVRQIDPVAEMNLVKKNSMLGDFDNAQIYIIGAGLLAEDAAESKGVYRSPLVMNALRAFWADWFTKSNATLVGFGQPALLNPVR